jgi:hypothetical protein
MLNREIPVVLVVAGIKIDYIPFVVNNLSKHCDFDLFYVVCPEKDIIRAHLNTKALNQKIIIVDEALIVPGLSLNEVKKFLKLSLKDWPEHHLPGWYFQQFLKMGFAQYLSDHEYYLIWDSDTVPTHAISFFDGDTVLLTQGNEFHKEYFDTIKTLLDTETPLTESHISQHLMVRTADMRSLIQYLNKTDATWWIYILSSLNGKTPFQFSEYETYSNFCLSTKPNSYRSIKRMWFRYGRSYFGCDLTQADTSTLAALYDFVAFEDWDVGILRSFRSYLLVVVRVVCLYTEKYINRIK